MAAPDQIIAEANAALVAAAPHSEDILQAVVDAMTKARPAIWVASLLTNDPAAMRVIGQAGSHPLIAQHLAAFQGRGGLSSASMSARVIESGEPLFLPSVRMPHFMEDYVDEAVAIHDSLQLPEELSALIVLMHGPRGVVGTLGMYAAEPDEKITQDQIRWVQVIADETALAIENARLLKEAKTRLEMVTALDELIHAVTSSHELSMVLNIVVDRITTITGIDASDLLLLDETDNTLTFAASSGFRSTMPWGLRLDIENPLIRQAFDSQRVEYLRSAAALDHASRRSTFMREGFVAYAAWPLSLRGKLAGALEVFHRSDLSLDSESTAFIKSLAAISAIAVEVVIRQERVLTQVPGRRSGERPDLSSTDWRILRLLVEGRTNAEIATELHLSPSTVKFRIRRILDKSGAANRTQLAGRAMRAGWV